MGYYEYDTGYYEPSDADIFFDEVKDKFREYLKDDIKYELDRLSRENEELREKNDKLRDENNKLNSEKRNAEWSRESIRKEVEDDFYSKAIDELFESRIENVDVWFADMAYHQKPKCEYCDDDRVRVYVYPDGYEMKQTCSCNRLDSCYEPNLATLKTLRYVVKPSRYRSERKYYMSDSKAYIPNDRYRDYGYEEFKILHIVDIFDDDVLDLRNDLGFGEKIGFKTKEECQKYCDWLNEQRK